MAFRFGRPLWRVGRAGLRGAALPSILPRAPARDPVSGGGARGGRRGGCHLPARARGCLWRGPPRGGGPLFFFFPATRVCLWGRGGALSRPRLSRRGCVRVC